MLCSSIRVVTSPIVGGFCTMTCELCEQSGGELLWQDDRCRVVLVNDPDYRGFCRVIWQRHVCEMSDLTDEDRSHLMSIVFVVEKILRETLAPDKINLASLGNQTPHLHWHVIPRYGNDKHFPNPIWGTAVRRGAERSSSATLTTHLTSTLVKKLGQASI
jgi:diadenosine tetraphosphate (Ap4A) HIT family hydrolase